MSSSSRLLPPKPNFGVQQYDECGRVLPAGEGWTHPEESRVKSDTKPPVVARSHAPCMHHAPVTPVSYNITSSVLLALQVSASFASLS